MSEVKMSFHAMMHNDMTRWYGHPMAPLLSVEEGKLWDSLRPDLFPWLEKPDHMYDHPALRYEDTIAHIFMQLVILREDQKYEEVGDRPGNIRRKPWVVKKIKSMRQYGNQLMKKVCFNCRFQVHSTPWLQEATQDSYEFVSILDLYAETIKTGECHKNCCSCRVANSICLASRANEFIFGYQMLHDEMEKTAVKWRYRWRVLRRKFKKLKFVHKKVLEDKRSFQKAYYASNEDRTRMQKELDERASGDYSPPDYIKMNMTVSPGGGLDQLSEYGTIPPPPLPEEDPMPPLTGGMSREDFEKAVDEMAKVDIDEPPTAEDIKKSIRKLLRPTKEMKPNISIYKMKYTGVEPPVRPWNREEQRKKLEEEE